MKTNKATMIAGILLLVFTGFCVWLVFQYVDHEKDRDLQNWQARLGVIAESQKRSIDEWLQKQLAQIQTLANNPLIQIHLTESALPEDERVNVRIGQLNHLKNLLNATAQMSGVFTSVKAISNNSAELINDGLALLNKQGVLLATRYFPMADEYVSSVAKKALSNNKNIISEIYSNSTGQPRFVIAVPVKAVQSIGPGNVEGVVVAVINPEATLYEVLTRHWLTTLSDESILVASNGASVTVLSPLVGSLAGDHDLLHQYSIADESLAMAYAAENIAGFALKKDYKNNDVLVTSRKIKNTEWILIQKVDANEALQESISHRKFILVILLLAVFFITVSFIAIWRHATSLRLQKTTHRLAARTELLNAVGNSIKDYIFLLDSKNKLVLMNQALAAFLEISPDDVRGKALNHLYDADTSQKLLEIKQGINGDIRNHELRTELKGRRYDFHITVVALKHETYSQSHLYVLHDITDLKNAQGEHNRLMQAIIQTVVRLIDVHDPHCENHSERTREVAIDIATAMDMEQQRLDALAMAAQLANIGKLHIPTEILTRSGTLSQEDTAILKRSTQYSVEILEGLEFEGPVIEIVKQKSENIDGSGYPQGLSGDAIMLESKILTVANAFVAMTSARAYRSGKPVKEVLDTLFNQVDKRYDGRVVAALIYVAENRSDWLQWQEIK